MAPTDGQPMPPLHLAVPPLHLTHRLLVRMLHALQLTLQLAVRLLVRREQCFLVLLLRPQRRHLACGQVLLDAVHHSLVRRLCVREQLLVLALLEVAVLLA